MTVQKDPEGTEAKYLLRYAEFGTRRSKRVLEIGCGDGRLTWRYARQARGVAAVDLHRDDLLLALADRPTDPEGIVSFAQADARGLPFPPGAFDVCIFAWSF